MRASKTATPIADLVEQMLAAGLSADIIVSAVRTAESHAQGVVGQITGTANMRARDRERKRTERAKMSTDNSCSSPNIQTDSPSQKEMSFDKEGRDSGIARAREAKPKSKATRLPADWTLSEKDRAFALTILPPLRIDVEAEKFRDYWHARAGPRSVQHNWSAVWRNWCRKSLEMNGINGNGQHWQSGNGGAQQGQRRGRGFSEIAVDLARSAGKT